MIKKQYALFLLLISYGTPQIVHCMDDNLFSFEDILDDAEEPTSDSELQDTAFIESDDVLNEINAHKLAALTYCEVLHLITSPEQGIEAQILLQENIYRRTNPNNSRSLLNLPGFYHHYFCPEDNYFWTQLFYNQTSNGYFTKESTQLQSYVLLNNPNLIERIERNDLGINLPIVLGVFSNMKLQDRRLGLMFGGQHVWSNWHVRAYAPFYYLERNLSLTDEEQRLLERAGLPTVDPVESREFAREHLIIDKLGIGDSRIEIGITPFVNDMYLARVGGLFTVPTAFAFKNGLYGTHFSKSTPAPNFSLYEFINTVMPPVQDMDKGIAQAEAFLLAAVDRLSTMVLETNMGNEGHFGLGVFTDHQIECSQYWTLRSKTSLEYLVPKYEKRFYIMKKTAAEFNDRDYNSDDELICEENLDFLNDQLIQTLFPTMYSTRIHPGYIFIWNTSLTYQGEVLDFQFGYDLYWQDKEKLGTINATPAQVALVRKDIAVKPCAYQSKLFGDLIYKRSGAYRDYHAGIHLDATLLSSGIGRDFTLALYFDMTI